MAEEKGRVVLFGKRWSGRATVAELLVSGELKDCSLEPIDSNSGCETYVGRGWTVVDTMGFGEPLGGLVPHEYVKKMAIDFLNEVKGLYSHIIFLVDRADFCLFSEDVMFPIPVMWRTFLETFKGGEENFVVLVTNETPDMMEFEWLVDQNAQDLRIKEMFPECKHFLFTDFGNPDPEEFLNDGHVVSRMEALERFEKEMEEMFTVTSYPWVEPEICKMGDAEIQEMATRISHYLTSIPVVEPRQWSWHLTSIPVDDLAQWSRQGSASEPEFLIPVDDLAEWSRQGSASEPEFLEAALRFPLLGSDSGPRVCGAPAIERSTARQQLQRRASWVLEVRDEMQNLGKEVKFFPRQCEYLLQRSMGASKELYDLVGGTIEVIDDNDNDYYLEPLLNSLDRLGDCTEAARELLQLCGNSEKEHEAALTLSSRPLPGTTDSHVSKFALVIRDLDWSLDTFRFLLHNPEAQRARSDSERQSWLSKFLWCESRGRLVYVEVGEDKDIGVESSTMAADNGRQAEDQRDLVSAMESHFKTFLNPGKADSSSSFFPFLGVRQITTEQFCSSEIVSYMSILRNRLHGDAFLDGDSSIRTVPSCFRIPGKQNYKIGRLLGKGSYKEVHKCEWLGMNVAIATEPQRNGWSDRRGGDSRTVLEAEAGLLARVQHPNVVTFIGYGYNEEDRRGFQVSEIMESSLRSLLNKAYCFDMPRYPFSVSQLIDILLQIVEAMIHVHECGVIYRDLKADNCLASRKAGRFNVVVAVVKLTDFGTSELQSPEMGCHFNTPNQGSPRWMAPELYQRPGEEVKSLYTWSADVYSFGMTCYEVVTGQLPFGINLFSSWLREEVRKGLRPPIPSNCPDELRELMVKCWAHRPEDRPTFKEIREILWRCKLNHTIFHLGPDGKFTEPPIKRKRAGLCGLMRLCC